MSGLKSRITGPTESGSEALGFTLDNLTFRQNAIPLLILFTDEDDDLPVTIVANRLREPPARTWLTDPRAVQFQARLDAVAQRLIDAQARLFLVINPRNKPSESQYGAPRHSQLDSMGRFDIAATLSALSGQSMQRSLEGQLLASGSCGSGTCDTGLVGYPCSNDAECSLFARPYDIRLGRRRSTRASFYVELINQIISQGQCPP